MKRAILTLLFISLIPAILFCETYVMLDTNIVKEGGIIKVSLRSNEPLKAADIIFMNKTYQAFYKQFNLHDTEYVCTAIIPVPLGTKGLKKMQIKYMLKDGTEGMKEEKIRVRLMKSATTEINTGKINDEFTDIMAKESKKVKDIQDQITAIKYDFPFIKPVEGITTGSFGDERDYDSGEAQWRHKGWDIAAKKGTPIHASNSGNVVAAGSTVSCGNIVVLDHGAGVYSMYYHMQKIFVNKDLHVVKGDILGTVGDTGIATGPHLHWQINVYKIPVNPKDFLKEF
ncbi:MAG: M23 family metallopeptidase [bacterium]